MTSTTSPIAAVGTDASRYWLVVHGGRMYSIDWMDGERLLSLSTDVRQGRSEPQNFAFRPRGSVDGEVVTLCVSADEPIELVSQHEPTKRTKRATLSHWFG